MRGIFSTVALLAATFIAPVLSNPAPAPAGAAAHAPELPELTVADFDSTIKSGYWCVLSFLVLGIGGVFGILTVRPGSSNIIHQDVHTV